MEARARHQPQVVGTGDLADGYDADGHVAHQADAAAAWLRSAMRDALAELLGDDVPVGDLETVVGRTWAGDPPAPSEPASVNPGAGKARSRKRPCPKGANP